MTVIENTGDKDFSFIESGSDTHENRRGIRNSGDIYRCGQP